MNPSKTHAKKTTVRTHTLSKTAKVPTPNPTEANAVPTPNPTEANAVSTQPLRSPVTSVPVTGVLASSATAPAAPLTPPGDLPPAGSAPAPREGWEPGPKKKRGRHGPRPVAVQNANASAVARELTESRTYAEDFGSRAPAAAQVAYVVTNAAKWRELWTGLKRYFAYVSEQRALWEDSALAQMNALKVPFDYAASRDAKLAEKYAATSKYLGAGTAIAQRALLSRKANARTKAGKAKAGAAAEVVAGASPSVASPAPEAPSATVDTGT